MSDENPVSTFLKAIGDRLSHPVMGIAALAFLAFNWKLIFFLIVSEKNPEERIVGAVAYADSSTVFWWPLLATVGYVTLSPILRSLAVIYNSWFERFAAKRLAADYVVTHSIKAARIQETINQLSEESRILQKKIEDDNLKHAAAKERLRNALLELSEGQTCVKTFYSYEELERMPSEERKALLSKIMQIMKLRDSLGDSGFWKGIDATRIAM